MEIRHKTTGAVLYKDESPTIRETLENAARDFRRIVEKSVKPGLDGNRQTVWTIDRDLLRTAPDLSGADLRGADLSGIGLVGREMGFVNPWTDDRSSREFLFSLKGADLSGANIEGAEFLSVDLSNAMMPKTGERKAESDGDDRTPSNSEMEEDEVQTPGM